MTVAALARTPTAHASKYLQQLCKHWSHSLTVDFTPEQGRILFPKDGKAGRFAGEAVVTLSAQPDTLECRIEASEPAQLEAMKRVLASHLDRFAFKEAPLAFDWTGEG